MYEYPCEVIDVYDGDTLTLQVDLGFRTFSKVKVRLLDIDTPEITGEERPEGLKATEHVLYWIDFWDDGAEWPFIVKTRKTGKYGRWLADLKTREDYSVKEIERASAGGYSVAECHPESLVKSLKEAGFDTGDWKNW